MIRSKDGLPLRYTGSKRDFYIFIISLNKNSTFASEPAG